MVLFSRPLQKNSTPSNQHQFNYYSMDGNDVPCHVALLSLFAVHSTNFAASRCVDNHAGCCNWSTFEILYLTIKLGLRSFVVIPTRIYFNDCKKCRKKLNCHLSAHHKLHIRVQYKYLEIIKIFASQNSRRLQR